MLSERDPQPCTRRAVGPPAGPVRQPCRSIPPQENANGSAEAAMRAARSGIGGGLQNASNALIGPIALVSCRSARRLQGSRGTRRQHALGGKQTPACTAGCRN